MGYFPYFIIGFILLIFSLYEVFSDENENIMIKKNLTRIIYIMIVVFLATRWYVGWDWYNYSQDFYEQNNNFEKGYRIFQIMIKKIYANYNFFMGLNTVIDFILIGYIIRKYSLSPIFTIFVYLGTFGLGLEIDTMRNIKSILLFIISLEYIKEKKIIPYLILNLIGMSFHITSIIFIPLYFILNKKINKKIILGIFLIGCGYYISNYRFFINILEKINHPRLSGYISIIPKENIREINYFFIERMVLFLVVFYGENFVKKEKIIFYNIISNSLLISILIFLYFSEFSIITLRIMMLFNFSYWIIFSIIIYKNKKMIKVSSFALVLFLVSFRSYNFLSFPGNKMTYKYENIFFKHNSYENKIEVLKKARVYNEEGKLREMMLLY